MEHQEIKFKTNLNCGNCISKVQAEFDQVIGAGNWNVDADHADKILTVKSATTTKDEVIKIVTSKGFKIESL